MLQQNSGARTPLTLKGHRISFQIPSPDGHTGTKFSLSTPPPSAIVALPRYPQDQPADCAGDLLLSITARNMRRPPPTSPTIAIGEPKAAKLRDRLPRVLRGQSRVRARYFRRTTGAQTHRWRGKFPGRPASISIRHRPRRRQLTSRCMKARRGFPARHHAHAARHDTSPTSPAITRPMVSNPGPRIWELVIAPMPMRRRGPMNAFETLTLAPIDPPV